MDVEDQISLSVKSNLKSDGNAPSDSHDASSAIPVSQKQKELNSVKQGPKIIKNDMAGMIGTQSIIKSKNQSRLKDHITSLFEKGELSPQQFRDLQQQRAQQMQASGKMVPVGLGGDIKADSLHNSLEDQNLEFVILDHFEKIEPKKSAFGKKDAKDKKRVPHSSSRSRVSHRSKNSKKTSDLARVRNDSIDTAKLSAGDVESYNRKFNKQHGVRGANNTRFAGNIDQSDDDCSDESGVNPSSRRSSIASKQQRKLGRYNSVAK